MGDSRVAGALNLNRVYFKTFQVLVQSPVTASGIMPGEVLAAMVKGLFAASLLIVMGLFLHSSFTLTPMLLLAPASRDRDPHVHCSFRIGMPLMTVLFFTVETGYPVTGV